jgi:hypothetical protein
MVAEPWLECWGFVFGYMALLHVIVLLHVIALLDRLANRAVSR